MLDTDKIIENINWEKIHKEMITGSYNKHIEIYDDGSHSAMDSGNYTQNAVAILVGYGGGNIHIQEYAEGWATEITDTEDENYCCYRHDETGEIMTADEMVNISIEEGEWIELEEEWKESVREDIQQQIQDEEDLQKHLVGA